MRYFYPVCILFCVLSFSAFLIPGDKNGKTDDVNNKFTNVGNIAMTVTNYGTIGNGFVNFPNQPSCQYPKGSGIENMFLGGLWIGGYKNGQLYVTTGALDVSTATRNEGFEFTNAAGSGILERSSLPTSSFYRPDAVSHQDFVCDFFDTNLSVGNVVIQNHTPMGTKVLLQSYTYDFNYANFFVLLNYKIINIGYRGDNAPIDSLYLGLWTDCVVRNTNITPPGGTSFYNKGGDGWIDTLRMAYEFDYNGDPGFTNNYIGIKLLGTYPKPYTEATRQRTNFTVWQFRNTTDPVYFSPTTDAQRYSKMQGFLAPGIRIDTNRINFLRQNPGNRSTLVTYGPYRDTSGNAFSLRYLQDTVNIVFGVICAKKNGTDPMNLDTDFQKEILYNNAFWAQRAYNGEDRNENGRLDPGEDVNGNLFLDRYLLPSPPDIPKLKTVIANQNVTLYWSTNGENSVDPISNRKDFEGYRIYRTNPGSELTLSGDLTEQLNLIADFDSAHNSYFNNTGFGFIKLNTPMTFEGDTTKYWYKFDFPNQLNGFQYVYTVTAYDKGDSAQNLESLESSLLSNAQRIVVGTPANNNENAEIGVYPNPYYGSAIWDGSGAKKEVLRKIYFYNLPSKCEISIWSLSGDLIDKLDHDAASYNGSDIEWFKTYSDGTQKFAGGEHAWDLISREGQAIATGLYLFTVKDVVTGNIKRGKFLIVK
ncbi:MAG TPA: hypothetical protein VHP32_08350 [Ignavibacteria bacterium]|nr:hypothetical protein [Ignavibacteria bacterium]